MNFFKRAWLSVTRRKGKSLLLFAIIFIIANVIAGAISIQQASLGVEKKIKTNMGAMASIEPDYEAVNKAYEKDSNFNFVYNLTIETIEEVGQSSYVKYFDYNTLTYVGSETLKSYVPEKLKENNENGGFSGPDLQYYAFTIRGVQYAKILDIEEKKINLVDGRVLTDEEVANGSSVGLISKVLAEENNLKVGDTIALANYQVDYNEDGTSNANKVSEHAIEIVGIFELPVLAGSDQTDSADDQSPDAWNRAFEEQGQQNTIYVPNKVSEDIMQIQYDSADQETKDMVQGSTFYTPVYVLNNPEDVDKFKEENQPLLPQYFTIMASSDQYDTIAAPVQAMSKMAGYVLIVAVLAAILIITLVVLLFLRDRKHELGIYLSFGEQRGKVFGQVLAEVLVIAFVAVSLAVVTGNIIANALSGTLIQQQLENTMNQDTMMSMGSMMSTTSYTTDDVIQAYEVSLTPIYILVMYAVGLGTTLLATLFPLAYILRLNPKKIMM